MALFGQLRQLWKSCESGSKNITNKWFEKRGGALLLVLGGFLTRSQRSQGLLGPALPLLTMDPCRGCFCALIFEDGKYYILKPTKGV